MTGRPGPVIHATKLPSRMPPERLHIRPGPDSVVATDPGHAGWRYLSFRAFSLGPGETVHLDRPEEEVALVTISGGGVELTVDGGRPISLPGRRSVFEGMPWSAYLPAGSAVAIVGQPLAGMRATVAVAQAPPTGRTGVSTTPLVVAPGDVEIEIRGRGNATRQVNN
ncbi:MAG TPA: 5-deoxy-glucuronate isomerase, partial [Candidatus Sulfotelmatobacter sp.]|nr:5-deoxy-glucuronate isomerase [Candidatus Sulfotelmatobacter sp.]